MGKYINADELMKIIKTHHYMLANAINSRDYGMFTTGIEHAINETESVEIVRCKDCENSVCIGDNYFCDIQYDKWGQPYIVKPDGYCDVGKRKEADE